MDFGIMFWGDALAANRVTQEYYQGLVRLARYADEYGFQGVWLPERHFHGWGGQHPNPSVLAAALATVTRRIRLRAGSVVLPLHNPLRVVEEWAVVDNLSGGRAEISVASGWKEDDFLLAPRQYSNRRVDVWESIDTVSRLWRGERFSGENGDGATISVSTYPRPIQKEIPIWITSAGTIETIRKAGSSGFGLLTHLLNQDIKTLAKKLAVYREGRTAAGLQGAGRVALMVHTHVGRDRTQVRETVRRAMTAYLLNSADLTVQRHQRAEWDSADPRTKAQLMELAFERYFDTGSLMGTPVSCQAMVEQLREIGVTEVCCLIDFGLPLDAVLDGMTYLAELRERCCR
jgi:natural product biosynthesis luciferase-like monooxygenase protein